jgi:GNAT superfamily N-acetyltransferase
MVDHAVLHEDGSYTYGGDHGEWEHDKNFCVDGMFYPDRSPSTGAKITKFIYRPIRVSWLGGDDFELFNTKAFTPGIRYELRLRWSDGSEESLTPYCDPLEKQRVKIATADHIRAAEEAGTDCTLTITAFDKKTKSEVNKERYGQKIFQLINETYCNLYGFSLLSEKQIDQFVDTYLGVIDMEMLAFVEDRDGNLIAAGLTMPSIAETLQKCNGEMFPFGWYQLLRTMYWKKPETLELLLIGVKPEWQSKGVNSLVFVDLLKRVKRMGFKYAETNANLESNTKVQAMWSVFEKEQHKKRWVFGKEI